MTFEEKTRILNEKATITNIKCESMNGIIYTLNNLYKEMLKDDTHFDLLRLGVVKMSAEVFELIMANMPENVTLSEYLSAICNESTDNIEKKKQNE